jgi:hypothetical protein
MRELRRADEQADAKAAATELRCQGAADLASIPIAEEESCQPAALWIDRDEPVASRFIPLRQDPAPPRLARQEAFPAPLRHQVRFWRTGPAPPRPAWPAKLTRNLLAPATNLHRVRLVPALPKTKYH